MSETRVVGRVRKAFGLKGELLVHPLTNERLKGELLVHPLTNEPGAVFASGRVVFVGDVGVNVQRARPFKDGWLVKLEGVDDKTAADTMRGQMLSADAKDLSEPEGNEVFLDELVGMRVSDARHGDVGAVAGWYELPQGLVLEVRGDTWRADIPFNEAFVVHVDRAAGTISVQLPEGMIEPSRASSSPG